MTLVGANVDEAGTGGVVDVMFPPKSVGKLRSWGVFGAAMGTGKAVDKESAKYTGSQGGWVTRRFNWKMRKIRRDCFGVAVLVILVVRNVAWLSAVVWGCR